MSERARKKTRTVAPEPAARKVPPRRLSVVVKRTGAEEGDRGHIPAERLREAELRPRPLPHRATLEGCFGTDLGGITCYEGPEVEAFLHAENADAAVVGDRLLVTEGAGLSVVAHEVAHLLQKRLPVATERGASPETEARAAEARVAANLPVPPIEAGLHPAAVAFRRMDDPEMVEIAVPEDRDAARDFEAAREAQTDAAAPEPATPARADATGYETAGVAVDLGADIPDEPLPTFAPAPVPEIEIAEGTAAAAEAATEAVAGAEDADALMAAFRDAPPSVKAREHDALDRRTGEMAAEDQANFEAAMPEFAAEMTGTDDLAEPAAVETPEARAAVLEDGAPPPPPEPAVDPTPEPQRANLNPTGSDLLSGAFRPGDAGGLGRSFSQVSTSDTGVQTTAGARPEVPLEGATDPQRVTDQDAAARTEAVASRQAATQAVIDGPGPEQVQLREVRESFEFAPQPAPEIAEAEGPVEGAAAFREKELEPEVVALFDAHHAAAMAESMSQATAETEAAVEARDTGRDTELANAEAEQARLNAEADAAQRDEVVARRQEVQAARQTAVDAQAGHVADLEAEAQMRRQETQAEIETQVSETEAEVETQFAAAEQEAEDEVQAGERRAEEERARREREAEDQSWWDRATDWLAEQFDRLTAFINDVFDAVRAAVRDIIDAVKTAAIALIDAAAAAITRAIEALGEVLRAAVNTLLAEHFPAVAAALNSAIDAAVDLATSAVNAIADGLKAAVSALLDALGAALDAILAAYQAAINAALAIARAALTGNWGELARLILEPVLLALGIQPAAFYEMIGRALEALDIMIDDPVGFLSNLVEAVVGGVRAFAGNFLTHLQAGIIGWLTGALGGDIQIPERWDLRGVLELARQILGLTVDMLRRIAVRVLGEAAVERIEFFMGYVAELITGGFSALWDRLVADLGNLKDMVLDAIRTFLVERIVMAAITWLVSLFNPIGALVKLVMTIWNFLMFLKDQLARIIEVVQTVVRSIYEIATGVLQPAIDSVEGVLGRLLPIAVDLLARLLGLGNVAGRVRRIIADVRQRIEDAIVRLIERVLSAFTGGRRGGGAGADDDADAADEGALMQPMTFGNEEEQHTLYLEERNGNVTPMMRSDPLPIETWLRDLAGDGARRVLAARRPALAEATIAERAPQIQDKARRALGIEEDLDEQGDRADQQPQLARTGGQLTRVLNEIMALIGGRNVGLLAEIFEQNVVQMHPELQDQMRLILRGIGEDDAKRMRELSWAQMTTALWDHANTPAIWKRPAGSGGVIRQKASAGAQFEEAVVDLAHERHPNLLPNEDAVNAFFSDFLTERLNQPGPARAIFDALLSPTGRDLATVAAAVRTDIHTAADARKASVADGPDAEVKDKVKGSTIFPLMREFADKDLAQGRREFRVWANNDTESGSSTGPYTLLQMLTESSVTERTGRNSEHVGDAIRAAGDVGRPHEWIQASTASMVMRHAANATASGNARAIKGASELIDFQEKVRTPTTKLIFKPGLDFQGGHVTVRYKAKPHRESDTYRKTPMARLPQDKRDAWYPPNHPREGDVVGVLQAHSGGLYAYAHGGGFRDALVTQSAGSTSWHNTLKVRANAAAAELVSPPYKGGALKSAIIGYYKDTIWTGATQPLAAAGKRFPNYYRTPSESAPTSYAALQTEFQSDAKAAIDTLTEQIDGVLGG